MQTQLTPETIAVTRKHFSENKFACIAAARSGEFFVNDLEGYCASCLHDSLAVMRGEWDHTFTFWQYATWLQTGVCHALLP